MLEIIAAPIRPAELQRQMENSTCGAYVSFEGWVRNHNEGRDVERLAYEVYTPIAESEGAAIVQEALHRFAITAAHCQHREGELAIGDCAVWVGVTAAHRGAAFDACRFIIDSVKVRLPIWKKEFYADGDSGWVNCESCAQAGHALGN